MDSYIGKKNITEIVNISTKVWTSRHHHRIIGKKTYRKLLTISKQWESLYSPVQTAYIVNMLIDTLYTKLWNANAIHLTANKELSVRFECNVRPFVHNFNRVSYFIRMVDRVDNTATVDINRKRERIDRLINIMN